MLFIEGDIYSVYYSKQMDLTHEISFQPPTGQCDTFCPKDLLWKYDLLEVSP